VNQTFVALVNQTPGLLARVDALFRRQSVALESLTYDGLDGTAFASLTIVARVSEEKTRLLVKHLARLVDVREVQIQEPSSDMRSEALCMPL